MGSFNWLCAGTVTPWQSSDSICTVESCKNVTQKTARIFGMLMRERLPELAPNGSGVANQSPLIAKHEIITVSLRGWGSTPRNSRPETGAKDFGVLADPVFSADDARSHSKKATRVHRRKQSLRLMRSDPPPT
jgi:hypothetical protein